MIDFILKNFSQLIVTILIQSTIILAFFLVLSNFLFKNKHVSKYNFLFLGLLLIFLGPIISSKLNIPKFNLPIIPQYSESTFTPKVKSENTESLELNSNKNEISEDKIDLKQANQNENVTIKPLDKPLIITNKNYSTFDNISLLKVALILWFAIFLFLSFKTILGYFKIKKIIYQSTPLLNQEILSKVGIAIRTLKINSQPIVLISEYTGSPFVAGFSSPKIIVPKLLLENYDESSFNSILFHELAHIKRNDVLIGLIQILIQNLLWFHPLIYFYNREMNYSREEICDNYSLTHHQPKCYASILTKLAEAQINNKANLSGINYMVSSKSELFNRIKNILNPNRKNSTNMSRLDILSIILILMITTCIISQVQVIKAEDNIKTKDTIAENKNLLDQLITINIDQNSSLSDIKSSLGKINNLNIKLHPSLNSIKDSKIKSFLICANKMLLKDFLVWIKSTMNIEYEIIEDQIIFCAPSMKNKIDINYSLESFSIKKLLDLKKTDDGKENYNTLTADNIKELIFDKISRDTWDDSLGTSIEIMGDNLFITHNKETLKNIQKFLSELEQAISEENNPNYLPNYEKRVDLTENSILELLNKNVSVNYQNKKFIEILEDISKNNRLSISYIFESDQLIEKLSHEKINFEATQKTLSQTLSDLLKIYSLNSQIINGAYFISAKNYFEKILTLERYNVKALCKRESCTTDTIKDLIISKINRNSWDAENGSSVVSNSGNLLIQTNHQNHELIRKFLKDLLAGKVKMDIPENN